MWKGSQEDRQLAMTKQNKQRISAVESNSRILDYMNVVKEMQTVVELTSKRR